MVLEFLILIHVLSSIIGVGPTFFAHVLLRNKQSVQELRFSYKVGIYLEYFPKIGGSIAVLSGLALLYVGDYGSFFKQLWLIGSLVLYIIIQIIVIGMITPKQKQVRNWLFDPSNENEKDLSSKIQALHKNVNKLFYVASFFGIILFIFMIVKPVVF
jgi:uncharacterized membrane protein